jgi:MYXO-CTERM domain-containing protein
MRRVFALLVMMLCLASYPLGPLVSFAQVDAGDVDSGTVDAGGTPDATPAPDAARGGFDPALDTDDGCDCATAGAGDVSLVAVVAAFAMFVRRRR